jgi:hypothetical protein
VTITRKKDTAGMQHLAFNLYFKNFLGRPPDFTAQHGKRGKIPTTSHCFTNLLEPSAIGQQIFLQG